ncbi:MAG: nucleotidyl transferase AbiEii/AbiGii toxin family protein [Candidatus Latescibacteria bacterium]|nr:nucleotidyl transferase AbiEii/AbiGii toxin family protein [Candidatus Latescibacterota bacterium]
MKEEVRQILASAADIPRRRNLLREYLQARTLQILQEEGAFLDWAFLGGTALRFLYALPRFSEDLDFSTQGQVEKGRFGLHLKKIKQRFQAEAYDVDLRVSEHKVIQSAFVHFRGLPHELGLSPHPSETISIKLEVDTNPPEGATVATTLVRRHVLLNLFHYDQASLLAGKLHALLVRRYTKGRDLYDLVWYLSDPSWPAPNLKFLNAALAQTQWTGPMLDAHTWRQVIWEKLAEINWSQAVEDVRPFLERQEELELITSAHCQQLLHVQDGV